MGSVATFKASIRSLTNHRKFLTLDKDCERKDDYIVAVEMTRAEATSFSCTWCVNRPWIGKGLSTTSQRGPAILFMTLFWSLTSHLNILPDKFQELKASPKGENRRSGIEIQKQKE